MSQSISTLQNASERPFLQFDTHFECEMWYGEPFGNEWLDFEVPQKIFYTTVDDIISSRGHP